MPGGNFGERLRTARLARGLTVDELAAKVHCRRHSVVGMEVGLTDPSPRTVRMYAEALGCEPLRLAWDEPPRRPERRRWEYCAQWRAMPGR